MKNNNYKNMKKEIIKIIDKLFHQNGKKEIPDVNAICSLTKSPRKTVLKYLCEWWINNNQVKKSFQFTMPVAEKNNKKMSQLDSLSNDINFIIREIDAHNESLNFLPNSNFPLGNYLIEQMITIEQKFLILKQELNDEFDLEYTLKEKLINSQNENFVLQSKIDHLTAHFQKKISDLEEVINASRREAVAAKHRAKSLKREKHTISLRHWLRYQNSVSG